MVSTTQLTSGRRRARAALLAGVAASVLRQACHAVRDWRDSVPGNADLALTVNVSVRQLLSGALSGHVADALAETGLPARALTLEITESMLLEDSETVAAELDRIRALGVRLAMDDFGAGYSSLAALVRLQVEMLKIDRSFVELGTGSEGALVRAVADIGRTLRLTVVAEGVETAEQLAQVTAAGCDAAQGYYLSRPMPEPVARGFLRDAATSSAPTLLDARTA